MEMEMKCGENTVQSSSALFSFEDIMQCIKRYIYIGLSARPKLIVCMPANT